MDAAALLRGDEPFVLDTSTWWRIRRLPADLGRQLRAAISDGGAVITTIVRIEILYSARTSTEYSEVDAELAIFRMLRNDRSAADQGGLTVLHRDHHFDRLAEVLALERVSLPVD